MSEPTQLTPNKKLRHERERRCWSQQEVADMVGTTPLNVSRWERGVNVPNPYFRQKLCEVFEKTAQELGLVPSEVQQSKPDEPVNIASQPVTASAPSSEVPAVLWNVPYRQNLFFTGREDILQQLRETLVSDELPVALTQSLAISGLGGIGKTQTAVEYAYRYRDNYTAVLWARAVSHEVLVSDYLAIASLLDLPERNEQDQNKIFKAVLHWFDTHHGWLLILDNADNLETVSAFIPSSGKGHMLLTTRASSTGTLAQRIDIEKMGPKEGTLFLLRRTKRLKGNAPPETLSEDMRKQAQAIVEALDGLPLALDQAGTYIEETGCSFPDYLKFYKTHRKRLLRMRGRDATGHPEPVATTWALSFERVEGADPAAADLLRLCAFLHPDEIPETMIVKGAAELGPVLQSVVESELEFNEAIGELRKYSLVKRDSEKKILNVHRLVQAMVRDGMEKETEKEWAERVVRMVNRAFPEPEFTTWPQCQQCLPHVQVCAELIMQCELRFAEAAWLLNKAGQYLQNRGRYTEAESHLLHALTVGEQLLEPNLTYLAEILSNLGLVYDYEGKCEQAEQIYQRAIAISEQALDSDQSEMTPHLITLCTLYNNLGIMYAEQGKYEQAEPLLQRTRALLERALGPEHPTVAHAIHNLGWFYLKQAKYEQAESLLQKALTIRERELGPEHLHVAYSLAGLARLYLDQGKYDQAEYLFQQVLTIREQSLGLEHREVAQALNYLAMLYSARNKHTEAEQFFQRAITLKEHTLGSNHWEVASSLNGLAALYRRQGRYDQAKQLLQRALTIQEQTLIANHIEVADTLTELAWLYLEQNKDEQVEPLFQRALSIREQSLGSEHPRVAEILRGLALLYFDQGKYTEAEALFQRSLAIVEQVLGVEHPNTGTILDNYAALLRKTGRELDAVTLEARTQAIRAKQE